MEAIAGCAATWTEMVLTLERASRFFPLRSGEVTYLTVGCADRIYRETVHAQTVRGVRTVEPLKANNSGKGVTESCQGNQGCERPLRARAKS